VIIGLGTDIVEIERIAAVYEKQGEKFLLPQRNKN
jgi:phosphopantetheinyl transferase (holo-ACP synthase)